NITPFKDDEKMKSFTLRYPGWLEARLTAAIASHSVSKNQFIVQLLERELR
ncbi:toxin-antitoxin system HicB family antitoxin, partial [Salmonella enterica]|nr:toxin-antitoxin system HicB family antitoxin [Salmonella enterica]